jgi:hypothetical protein
VHTRRRNGGRPRALLKEVDQALDETGERAGTGDERWDSENGERTELHEGRSSVTISRWRLGITEPSFGSARAKARR